MPTSAAVRYARALSDVAEAASNLRLWRTALEGRIGHAVSLGIPLREVGRAAGVDASTAKRWAEKPTAKRWAEKQS